MNRFLWLLRREVWESRAIWIAPAVCLVIVVGGAAVAGLFTHHVEVGMGDDDLRTLAAVTAEQRDLIASGALASVAVPFLVMVGFVQFFYSIDSLYGERRDRSILFWKSLPVSDVETVLSKLATAGVVLPALAVAATVVAQVGVALITSVKLSGHAGLAAYLWHPGVWGQVLLVDLYVALAGVLWYAPLIALYLLVSSVVRRSPFGVFLLGILGVFLIERIVFGTHHVLTLALDRSMGLVTHLFTDRTTSELVVGDKTMHLPHSIASNMVPGEFLALPAVWIGLVVAAACVAGAAYVRRYRDATY